MGTAAGSLCLATVITAYLNGTSSPELFQTAALQTHGVSHDLPRRSPSGRRRAPPSSLHRSYKSYKSYASVTPTQHAYRRCHQKSPAYPCGNSAPGSNQTAVQQALGVSYGAPILSDKSDRSDLSVTPTQHAYRRCHQVAKHYPNSNSAPESNQTAAGKPTGYTVPPPSTQKITMFFQSGQKMSTWLFYIVFQIKKTP